MSKSTVVLFALSPEQERKRKPVLDGDYCDIQLYSTLKFNAEWQTLWQSISLLRINENIQQGNTFAQRFCNAIEYAFNKGHENLVLIGNDAPEINTEIIAAAFRSLREGKSAIVTTQRGGACLIAISRQHYNRETWLNLPWQSQELAQALVSELNDVSILGDTIEIHDKKDILKLIKRFKIPQNLIIRLLDILKKDNEINFEHKYDLFSSISHQDSLRGPPGIFQ